MWQDSTLSGHLCAQHWGFFGSLLSEEEPLYRSGERGWRTGDHLIRGVEGQVRRVRSRDREGTTERRVDGHLG